MKAIFEKYIGNTIAYTLPCVKEVQEGVLIEACETYFVINDLKNGIRKSYNYSIVMCAIDSDNGIKQKGIFKRSYPLMIDLYQQVIIQQGSSTGYGFGIMF